MSCVPWSNETERADYWKSAWETERKESEKLQAQLAAKDAEIERLRAERQRYADVHARSLSLRRKHEYTIQCLTAERDTAVDERDTLMRRHAKQVEVIRHKIDDGGFSPDEQSLLDDLMLPRHFDRRGAGEG